MPEEINRLVTDRLSDLLLVSEPEGVENLRREGHTDDQIFLVGNVMIDTLMSSGSASEAAHHPFRTWAHARTLLRCDASSTFKRRPGICTSKSRRCSGRVSASLPIVFPIHPRTRDRLQRFALLEPLQKNSAIRVLEPLGYNDFLSLTSRSKSS